MTEHTKTDGIPQALAEPGVAWERPRNDKLAATKVECNACPVLCQISVGKSGACDRYANVDGTLIRVDPVVLLRRTLAASPEPALVPFAAREREGEGWFENPLAGAAADPARAAEPEAAALRTPAADGSPGTAGSSDALFVTGLGASTTYPDYKPAPFIVSSEADGVDLITVVTEGIFSYCSFKVKIDTDRWLGPEQAAVRAAGEVVGHVTTAEYGSQMLSLGGVHHLTGGSKKEGRVTCETMLSLGNKQPVELAIDGGARLVVQAGAAPLVDGVRERRMRVGCGSATVGIFAKQFAPLADEVIVVDDHITGVLSQHQAGRCLGMRPSGVRIRGRKSTPGRWFQVAEPGTGWGGTDLVDPLAIVEGFDAALAWPGQRLLMTSTTGEHAAWYVLDEALVPREAELPAPVARIVERIGENCEPSLASVLFLGGAGGSLRAGVTDNPVQLTRAIKRALVNVTCGGAPAYVWPGGGITVMVDVARMPERSFGTVPTPAIVAPIEFSMRRTDYEALGGHPGAIRTLADTLAHGAWHRDGAPTARRIETMPAGNPWPLGGTPVLGVSASAGVAMQPATCKTARHRAGGRVDRCVGTATSTRR